MVLTARTVDPRDETWEEYNPAYRVYFWGPDLTSYEWELVDCDVQGALAWAEGAAEGRPFTLYAVLHNNWGPGEMGMVRLLGDDPTRTDGPSAVADLVDRPRHR